MRCYYHHDKEAVGMCRSCSKGLCPDCAVDVGKALACRGHCEEDVRAFLAFVHRSNQFSAQSPEKIMASARKARFASGIFLLVLGLIFTVWGVSNLQKLVIIAVMGACFLIYGAIVLWQTRKM